MTRRFKSRAQQAAVMMRLKGGAATAPHRTIRLHSGHYTYGDRSLPLHEQTTLFAMGTQKIELYDAYENEPMATSYAHDFNRTFPDQTAYVVNLGAAAGRLQWALFVGRK